VEFSPLEREPSIASEFPSSDGSTADLVKSPMYVAAFSFLLA
jgi:hypothetical protein